MPTAICLEKRERWVQFPSMAKAQLAFKILKKPKDEFGGSLLKGNPKTKRPIHSRFPILLTLRANQSGMRKPLVVAKVHQIVHSAAEKYGVKIYEFANVGNHLHAVICVKKIRLRAGFIREVSGRIAQLMKDEFKIAGKFWMFRPHTRIVRSWKLGFKNIKDYVLLNIWEAEGHINRKETKTLKDLRAIFETG